MRLKFTASLASAAVVVMSFLGSANADTITNSYTMGTIGVQVSGTGSGALINSWSYTDPATDEDLAANVSVVTGDGASSQYASATGDSDLSGFARTSGSWTDTFLVTGPGNGSTGTVDIYGALGSSANGSPVTDDVQVVFTIGVSNLTAYRGGNGGALVWNPCISFSLGCNGGTYNQTTSAFIPVVNGDVIQISGTLTQYADAQQPSGSGTYSLSSTADISSIEASSGFSLTPVPLPGAAGLLLSGLGGLVAMMRKRRAA